MILSKLQEALEEVEAQRNALNEVEKQLRATISMLSGVPDTTSQKTGAASRFQFPAPTPNTERDGIDDIVDILRAEGKPLHITVIAERLSTLRGTKILRTAIEPGMNRHVAKTKKRRIDKFGRSIFGLPEWKQQQLFTKTA